MFTVPFYNILKDGGEILHENVDPDYRSYFINMLAWSFDNSEDSFKKLLQKFKEVCLFLWGREYNLIPLIISITNAESTKNKHFFGTLANSTEIFDRLLDLLKEKRISSID